jgi:4-amino-4-deoxy-L-arabinose transferase-like glycosyltransferase
VIKYPGVTTTDREAGRFSSFDFAAFAILLLACAFRFYRIDIPLIDGHSWRQVTNADITRHFFAGTMNPFEPRVSWGGLNGLVGMEFPLLHYLTAIAWRLTGEAEQVARLVTIAFSVTSVALIYFLGTRLFGRPAGRAAAFLLAVSPSVVYFGRSFLSDTPMLTFSIGAVLAWDRYFDRPTVTRVAIATIVTALAALVKLPAILVLGAIGGLALSRAGWSALRDRGLWGGCVAALAMVAGWYWYADRIYLETGLTQAVFRPSGTYPQEVAPDVFYGSISHWATRARLLSGEFWGHMIDRFWALHLTPFGFFGALIGAAFLWRTGRALVVGLWTLAAFLLLVVSAEGQWLHEFHQLPLLPPLALLFGVAAAPLFDGAFLKRYAPLPVAAVIVAAGLVIASFQAFKSSNVIPSLYRPHHLAVQFLAHGSFLQSFVPPDALIITVDYYTQAANSPMLLYYARRQGWSFDVTTISPKVVDRLRTAYGARYLVSSIAGELLAQREDMRYYVTQYEQVPPPPGMGDLLVVDLQKPLAK